MTAHIRPHLHSKSGVPAIDALFDSFFQSASFGADKRRNVPEGYEARWRERPAEVVPLFDVYANEDEIVLEADLPGVAPEDLEIQFEKRVLTVEAKAKGVEYRRRLRVKEDVEDEAIEAELANGVLRIRLPKSEAAKPRTIRVRTA